MSIEVIKGILNVEEQASELVKEAKLKAKAIHSSASAKAHLTENLVIEKAEAKVASLIKDAEEKAAQEYDAVIKEAQLKCEEMKVSGRGKLKEASEFIAGRVVESIGNS